MSDVGSIAVSVGSFGHVTDGLNARSSYELLQEHAKISVSDQFRPLIHSQEEFLCWSHENDLIKLSLYCSFVYLLLNSLVALGAVATRNYPDF